MERALRIATWIAAAMMAAGLALWLVAAPAGDPLMHGGLLLLIATPIARVVLALVDFLRARDWRFAAVACVVLASLAYPIVYFLWSLSR